LARLRSTAPPDFLGGGEADPDRRILVGPLAHLDEDRAARQRRGLGRQQEVRALSQAFKAKFRHEKSRLSGENLKPGLWKRRL